MANARAFVMPKWGIEMLEGTVSEWSVEPGQAFKKGDILALIETDKINNEVEAEFDGVLARRIAAVGDTLPVGALLGVMTTEPMSPSDLDTFVANFRGPGGISVPTAPTSSAPATPAPAAVTPPPTATPTPAAVPAATPAPTPSPAAPTPSRVATPVYTAVPGNAAAAKTSPAARNRLRALNLDTSQITGSGREGRITLQDVVKATQLRLHSVPRTAIPINAVQDNYGATYASPLATRIAVEHHVSLVGLSGTGPRGRISKADVLALVPANAPAHLTAGAKVVRMSSIRKAIAQRLTQSKSQIPHFYLRVAVKVDALQDLRTSARRATGAAPSVNDFLIRAVALALHEVPDMNIQVHGDEVHHFPHADIAVAVASDKGLITPIVFAADTKTVAQISAEMTLLAQAARAGTLAAAQFKGGSFTISNLGMFGIDEFDAIINPPQGAILAVGAAQRRPIETDYALSFASVMRLSLSCDHRAIDGAVGATFMAKLRALIEEPGSLTK